MNVWNFEPKAERDTMNTVTLVSQGAVSNPGLWTLNDLRAWDTAKLRYALENVRTATTPLIDGKFACLGDLLDALKERKASTEVAR